MINSNLQYQNKHCHEKMNILENQSMSLLSRNACVALDLIKVKDSIHEVQPKGPVPLERIAVAITSDYEIPAFLGIRR